MMAYRFSMRPVDIKPLTLSEFDDYARAVDDLAKGGA
jgi:hypothetical protein